MGLQDRLEDQPEIDELRQALIRTQRQLKQAKARVEHLAEVTIQAAHDAALARPIGKVPAPGAAVTG